MQAGRRRGGGRPDGDPRAQFATFYGAHALPKTVQQIFNQTNKAPNKKPGFLFNTRRDLPAGAAARSWRLVEPNLARGGGGRGRCPDIGSAPVFRGQRAQGFLPLAKLRPATQESKAPFQAGKVTDFLDSSALALI